MSRAALLLFSTVLGVVASISMSTTAHAAPAVGNSQQLTPGNGGVIIVENVIPGNGGVIIVENVTPGNGGVIIVEN